MYVFDEEPIRQYDLKTGEVSEIEGFQPIEFTSYFTQPFSPDGTIILSDDYPAFIEISIGDFYAILPNRSPKGKDLFKNKLLTGEKIRLLPRTTGVQDFWKY